MNPFDLELAKAYYPEDDEVHGLGHMLRVLRLAEHIARREGADIEVVRLAAMLHDIARRDEEETGVCHAEEGARRARRLLEGYPPEVVEAVAHAIASHRFRGRVKPQTLEAKVLSDADKLDALGAVGVVRAVAYALRRGEPVLEPGKGPFREFAVKLSALAEAMYTETGRKLARERLAVMESFFEELEKELARS